MSRRGPLKTGAEALLPVDWLGKMQTKVGFRALTLQTADLEAMRQFYGATLGLATREFDGAVVVQAGSTELRFERAESGKPSYHFAFNIPENHIERARDWLKRRTPVVQGPGSGEEIFHFESWNAHAVYFFDPGGNIVEFIARHTLPNSAKGEFSERSVLYASELGWVVPDVGATVSKVEAALGLKPYRPPAPDFAAVGDEHALLILAREGRTWFGTETLAAARHPAMGSLFGKRAGLVEDGVFRVESVA